MINKWSFLVLLGAAFVVRCAELHTSGKWENPLMLEPTEQVLIAQGLADGQGFITPFRRNGEYVQDPSAYSPPAYPYLLAAVLKAGRVAGMEEMNSYRVALLLSVLAASLTVVLLAMAGGTLCGRAGFWLVGLVASVWPSLVTNSTALWDTPFTVVAIGLAVHIAVMPRGREPGPWWSMGAGLLSGVFMLFNPLVSPMCLAALAARYFPGGAITRRAAMSFALMALVWTATAAPWMVRNFVLFDRLVPVRNTFGFTLWVGNQPDVDGRATSSYRYQIGANAAEKQKIWEMGEDAYMRMKTTEAMDIIRADPARFWRRTIERIALFWTGDLRNQTIVWGIAFPMIGEVNALKAIVNILFLLCAVGGAMLWGSHPGRWVCWLGLLVMPLPYYFTHYSSNYRVFVDPILCVMAGVFFLRLLTRLRGVNASIRGGP